MSNEQTQQEQQSVSTETDTSNNEVTTVPTKPSRFYLVVFEDKGNAEGVQCDTADEFFNWADLNLYLQDSGVHTNSVRQIDEKEALSLRGYKGKIMDDTLIIFEGEAKNLTDAT